MHRPQGQRSSVQDLLYPTAPAPRRDFHRDNLRQLAEKQREARDTDEGKGERAVKERQQARKAAAFARVQPRVETKRSEPLMAPAGQDVGFLRAGSRKHKGPPPAPTHAYEGRRQGAKAAVPTAAEAAAARASGADHTGPKDYVRANLDGPKALGEAQRRARQQEAAKPRQAKSTREAGGFGKVPQYLRARKHELAAEDEMLKRGMRKSTLPAGWRKMEDGERDAILLQLQQTFAQKSVELQRMPMMVETVSARRKKAELEGALAKLEKSMALFKKPVYVDEYGGLKNHLENDAPICYDRLLQ